MAATWTLMALLGLDGLFRLFPWAYTAFKIAGALYLLYVAWTTWRGARDQVSQSVRPRSRAFLGGLLVNLANPKSVLFAAAVLVVIFPQGLSAADMAVVVGNHLLFEVAVYTGFAVLLGTPAARTRYTKRR